MQREAPSVMEYNARHALPTTKGTDLGRVHRLNQEERHGRTADQNHARLPERAVDPDKCDDEPQACIDRYLNARSRNARHNIGFTSINQHPISMDTK